LGYEAEGGAARTKKARLHRVYVHEGLIDAVERFYATLDGLAGRSGQSKSEFCTGLFFFFFLSTTTVL
jgi:hypothetical protein